MSKILTVFSLIGVMLASMGPVLESTEAAKVCALNGICWAILALVWREKHE